VTQPSVTWTPPDSAQGRTERLVRGVFLVFLVAALSVVALLVLRPGEVGFPVGACLRGHWSDISDSDLTLVECSDPHDYVVWAIVDNENDCPPFTIGRVPLTTGGLVPKDRYECLRAA
jgi:hypothetical protein